MCDKFAFTPWAGSRAQSDSHGLNLVQIGSWFSELTAAYLARRGKSSIDPAEGFTDSGLRERITGLPDLLMDATGHAAGGLRGRARALPVESADLSPEDRFRCEKSLSKQEPSIVFWAKPAIYGSTSNFGSSLSVSKSVFSTEPCFRSKLGGKLYAFVHGRDPGRKWRSLYLGGLPAVLVIVETS